MWNELIAEMETQYSLPASSSVLLSERLREVIHQAFLSMLSGTASTPRLPGQGAPAALPPPPSSSAAEASLAPPVEFPARYEDLGLIGMGGMGEVRRVLDRVLQRQLAMKIIHGPSRLSPDTLARFMAEARITAQLEHPGIVPVHDLGTLPDGRAYFTMKEVQGRSFSESIREMHRSATQPPRWSLRRLVDIFLRICESVAYAHARGVIHRDLKPSNIMVGEFGEVVVVDWGVAGLKGHSLHAGPAGSLLPPVHAPLHEHVTLAGMILGTLSYMPVEQARGEVERLGFTADVYALGAILYEIISGHPPYTGSSWGEVLRQLLAGPPAPLSSPLPVPEALQEICARAMARNAEDRYPDAGVLASEVGAWLDGARRREQALAMIALAEQRWRESATLRAEAHAFESRARALLKQVPYHAPAEAKKPAWALQDRAAQLQQEASIQDAEFLRYVWASMTHVPELAEARALAADYFQRQHAIAEEEGDAELAVRSEELLRSHDDGRHAAYLQGHGALWLWTEPSGAEVELFHYRERDRLLVPEPVRLLGRTPLNAVELPAGSYLLRIRAPGMHEVSYPVFIRRLEHWTGIPPSGTEPLPIVLPRLGELGLDEVYVPSGWFWSGGDPLASNSLPLARFWLEGFVIRRFPVTIEDYLEFLNDLVAQGREEDVLQRLPPLLSWEEARGQEDLREQRFVRDEQGRVLLARGELRWPVTLVNWYDARAYAEWRSWREGLSWRLPSELEHEKAARGVDRRVFPWGRFLDPSFCHMRDSHSGTGRALKAVVDAYPVDESPYGARGMAGNAHEWCLDAYQAEGPESIEGRPVVSHGEGIQGPGAGGAHRVYRGGSWRAPESLCRVAYRDAPPAIYRNPTVSFRLARSLR